MTKIVPDDRARQGPSGRPVLGVLIGALVLCVLALGGYMIWAGSESPDSPSQEAARENTTGSPSGSSNANPTNRISPANPA
jgi:flagellar basal body-associated protein FliL